MALARTSSSRCWARAPSPDRVWDNVNLGWVGFFTLCGLLNLYVAFSLSQEMWVNFKVFGLLGMTLVFTLLSGVYLYRHMPAEQNAEQKNNRNQKGIVPCGI